MTKGLVVAIVAYLCLGCGPAPTQGPVGSPLALTTEPRTGSCQTAALLPVRIEEDGQQMRFVLVGTGQEVKIVWPEGFSARLVDGVAVLIAPDGLIVGHEHDVLDNLGGGAGADASAFHVCSVGARTY